MRDTLWLVGLGAFCFGLGMLFLAVVLLVCWWEFGER